MGVAGMTEQRQYLTFKLDEEIFAFEILKVREVIEFDKLTKVPQTPHFMLGVLNLRGSVVPVLDMGLKLGMPEVTKTVDTCVIIIELTIANEPTIMGVLVDAVQEVIELGPDAIDPPPKIGTQLQTDFIAGMGKHEDYFIVILNLNKVFSMEELALVQDLGEITPEIT